MSKRPASHKIRDVVFGILSFMLALLLTLLSFCVVAEATVFNKTTWLDIMNGTEYYQNKTDEIRKDLVDLGYASGLEESFFNDVVDEVMVTDDTAVYISGFFSGESVLVDTKGFKQNFTDQLNECIRKSGKKVSDENNISFLVNKASSIYSQDLKIPALKSISPYYLFVKKYLPFVIAALAVLSVILILVFVFSNKWKHRSVKYIYYASAAAFLVNLAAAIIIAVNGGAGKLNVEARSVYYFFVGFVNNINLAIWLCAALFFVVSASLYFLFRKLYLSVLGKTDGI